mmetsp:Transcript_10754/g.23127  ORF Transcript_10754/g.23127 Transcript_10754/m.23127 type:complete len:84 (+) Transcript_10754:196-447(+)
MPWALAQKHDSLKRFSITKEAGALRLRAVWAHMHGACMGLCRRMAHGAHGPKVQNILQRHSAISVYAHCDMGAKNTKACNNTW